ncbi:MAG: hypothetical protein ACKV2V_07655 [Blastocatellia bacterium]
MGFINNLTLKDKHALLIYLGIVLLCAACFAVGVSIGRDDHTVARPVAAPAQTSSIATP